MTGPTATPDPTLQPTAARARPLVVVAALAAAIILGTALAWKVLPSEPPDVFIIGDSVTYMSAGQLQQQFDPTHLQFVAKPGFTSTDLLPLVDEAMAVPGEAAAKRDQVAVLVGYNDVRVNDLETPSLQELVETTAEFRCGIWLTLPARPGGKDATNPMARSDLIDQWNVRMIAEVSKHSNLHIVDDWSELVTSTDLEELLDPKDGVHPNEAGQKALAKAYRDGLERHCGS